jgi:hypothetical protein
MIFFTLRIKLFASLIALVSIVTSCSEPNSDVVEPSDNQDSATETTNQVTDNTSSIDSSWIDTNCLDIFFIESIESGWESSYQNSRLAKNGFTRQSSRSVENGEEFVFVNKTLKNTITILKSKFPDGESIFSVEYIVKQEQIECFKNTLTDTKYQKNDSSELYKKKGLGTYEEKTINVLPNMLTITYIHRIGKELSMPSLELVQPNLELLELE